MLRGAAHHLLQIREREQRYKPHGIGAHHAVGRELVLLVVIGGHHSEQRAVWHVHRCVGNHHEQVERVGPDAFAQRPEVGCIEQQGKDESEGHGPKEQPGSIGAPSGLGSVGNGP